MVTDTSKSLRFQKTQMFSQTIDQKEHKNNRYKLEPATWCYKHHSTVLRGWSTYSSGEAYGWCNCRQVLDMSILVKLHEMSILLHKFGCCACHVARQVVDVLTRQKANSLTVICFPIAIDVRKYHITEEYE